MTPSQLPSLSPPLGRLPPLPVPSGCLGVPILSEVLPSPLVPSPSTKYSSFSNGPTQPHTPSSSANAMYCSSSALSLLAPFRLSAPPSLAPSSSSDPPWAFRSPAPPWCVDSPTPPQASGLHLNLSNHRLHLGSMLPQLHCSPSSLQLHLILPPLWLHQPLHYILLQHCPH